MTKENIEKAKRRAWIEMNFHKKGLSDEEVMSSKPLPSANFSKEFKAGMNFALSHQWVSVEDRLPEPGQEVLLYNNNSVRRYEIGWLRKKKGDRSIMMTKEQYEKFCKDAENLEIYDGRNTFDLYECKKCPHKLVTTYAVKGVTPFTIRCSECGMTMTHTRTFGSVPDYVPVVKWVRPTYEQYKKLSAGAQEHIENGGLMLEKEIEEL